MNCTESEPTTLYANMLDYSLIGNLTVIQQSGVTEFIPFSIPAGGSTKVTLPPLSNLIGIYAETPITDPFTCEYPVFTGNHFIISKI